MVISGFQALRQARAAVVGLEPATEGSLQISGRILYSLYHRPPQDPYKKRLACRLRTTAHSADPYPSGALILNEEILPEE
ncbi:hypothetical protein PoB_007058200 [Plakobranchus ocellatus]|uniref:Uncharacterized protein n=1 Tax=Plakobranchus ocellatus TaxID=259542 RepID=A0AAV4DJ68_9GAST|nr:hypothetical protein PoB_007058200 [Plakobranchus ocellatus]